MDINNISITGRLTRNAELKKLKDNNSVTELTIATNRKQNSADYANFFNVNVYGAKAENLYRHLKKGIKIGVEGELRQNRWERDGRQQQAIIIVAHNIQFMEAKNAN